MGFLRGVKTIQGVSFDFREFQGASVELNRNLQVSQEGFLWGFDLYAEGFSTV